MNRESTKRAILLNDTSGNNHWGCELTIRVLRENLARRGINLVVGIPIRTEWNTARFREAIRGADIVIVNGEGSLHGSRDFAKEMLRVVEMREKHQSFFLINSVYGKNDAEMASLVRRYDKVWVRESRSLSALAAFGLSASITPDLLFWMNGQKREPRPTIDVLFTDSVTTVARTALYEKSFDFSKSNSLYLTMKKSAQTRPYGPKRLMKIPREIWLLFNNGVRVRNPGPKAFCGSIDALFGTIRKSSFVVTGRFHMVVLSLLFGIPFVAISSNSHKIEGLLEDAGLQNRLLQPEDLGGQNLQSFRAFTDEENQSINSYLLRARSEIDQMFDEIAASG